MNYMFIILVSCSSNEKIGRIETKLTREVNKLLMDGWELQGGISIETILSPSDLWIIMAQAMVKED